MRNLSDNLNNVFEKLQNPERGIETGFYELDQTLLGFKPSELIIVAGRPSIGKTSLMTDFILHAGKTKSVVVFSAEMSYQILALMVNICTTILISGFLISLRTIEVLPFVILDWVTSANIRLLLLRRMNRNLLSKRSKSNFPAWTTLLKTSSA